MVILLDKDGNASFSGKALSEKQLAEEIERYAASVPEGKAGVVFLKVDSRCLAKRVQHVLKLCTEAGITDSTILSINTDVPPAAYPLPAAESRPGR